VNFLQISSFHFLDLSTSAKWFTLRLTVLQHNESISHDLALKLLLLSKREKKVEPKSPKFVSNTCTIMENHSMIKSLALSGASSYSFEIKPKWGFLPHNSKSYTFYSILTHSSRCRFHMHSHLKERNDVDQYCPLDLFSDDLSRTKSSICELMKLEQSNNWKVFLDSSIIPSSQYDQTIAEMLPNTTYPQELLAEIIARILSRDGILARLKHHQKNLDGVDGIQGLKYAVDASPLDWDELNINFNNVDFNLLLTRYLAGDCELKQRVYEHVISMTLKDCVSIHSF
jgi:hypothetical protein